MTQSKIFHFHLILFMHIVLPIWSHADFSFNFNYIENVSLSLPQERLSIRVGEKDVYTKYAT